MNSFPRNLGARLAPALLGAVALVGCAAPSADSVEDSSATSAAISAIPTCLNGVGGLPVSDGANLTCKVLLPIDDASRVKIQRQTFGAVKDVVLGGTFQLPVTFDGIARILQEHRIALPMQEVSATLDLGRGGKSTVSVTLAPHVELEGAGFCDIHATKGSVGVLGIEAAFLPSWVRDGLVRTLNGNEKTGAQLVDAVNGALAGARKGICHG